MKPTKIQYPE